MSRLVTFAARGWAPRKPVVMKRMRGLVIADLERAVGSGVVRT
jgi:hypothetical protein